VADAATIARPYAKAAFEFARDAKAPGVGAPGVGAPGAGTLAAWSKSLSLAAGLVGDPRVVDLISNPKIAEDRIVEFFDALDPSGVKGTHWCNFIRLALENKRLELLPEIAARFEELRAAYESELDVLVTSAVPMSESQQAKLAESLKSRLKSAVRITTAIDPTLLGGAVIRAGDLVIDGSIKGRLERMASALEA
jgi:F-type H+-transporting ATPase subunit delta